MTDMTHMTLKQIRDTVRQRADIVNSKFVTDDELNNYINLSYYELYDLIVQKYGDNYYVQVPYVITTDGVNNQFALPDDFYKLLGVDLALTVSLDSYVTIRPFTFADRNRYAVPNFQSFYGVTNLRYRLNGDNLLLTPIPAANQKVRIWYVPELIPLEEDDDEADGISGWLEYVIVDAAIKCMQKEESDCSILMAQKADLTRRIEAAAENRDAGSPATVADSQWGDYWFPTGSGQVGMGGSF